MQPKYNYVMKSVYNTINKELTVLLNISNPSIYIKRDIKEHRLALLLLQRAVETIQYDVKASRVCGYCDYNNNNFCECRNSEFTMINNEHICNHFKRINICG